MNYIFNSQENHVRNMYTFMHKSNKRKLFSFSKPKKLQRKRQSFSGFNNSSNNSVRSTQSSPMMRFFSSLRRNRRRSTQSLYSVTSQLPKPVECIEVGHDDHFVVPPVKIDGQVVTSYQYLTLHDANKYVCDESPKKPRKKSLVRKTSQRLSHALSTIKRNNRNVTSQRGKKEKVSPLKELYNNTFNHEYVGDLEKDKQQNNGSSGLKRRLILKKAD